MRRGADRESFDIWPACLYDTCTLVAENDLSIDHVSTLLVCVASNAPTLLMALVGIR
jgi:hypothetical protein